jgi:aspartate aminotransferase-like enzyme
VLARVNEDQRLRIPGPTPIPPQVARAMGRPMISHRGSEFRAIMHEVSTGLQYVFQTSNECLTITGSATAAMEAAVANLVAPKTPVLAVVSGKFGERWRDLLLAFGADAEVLEVQWGQGVSPEALADALDRTPAEVVFLTHNESSTAVRHDIAAAARVCRQRGSLVVVDAVSSLGGAEFRTDQWGIDVVVSGSQKCLMLPPGLSFLAVSEAAWQRMESVPSPRYYLDLPRYRRTAQEGETPYTPAVSLILGLQESLRMIRAEGLEVAWERHRLMKQMVRQGLQSLGLELFVPEKWASPTVTAASGPRGLDVDAWRKSLQRQTGVVLSGGQDQLSGRIFRVGHMGYTTPLEMLATLAAIELGLAAAGLGVKRGAGVAAAEEVWLRWA